MVSVPDLLIERSGLNCRGHLCCASQPPPRNVHVNGGTSKPSGKPDKRGHQGCLPFTEKKSNGKIKWSAYPVVPFGIFCKLWATGQGDTQFSFQFFFFFQ